MIRNEIVAIDQTLKQVRPPKWSRDEIILTLNFYFSHYPKIPDKQSKEIEYLSVLLRSLTDQLGRQFSETYRNSNGVYMKLMNFHHFNNRHQSKGLKGGSKLDEKIFREFEHDQDRLNQISSTIISWVNSKAVPLVPNVNDEEMEVVEGRLLTRVHHYRERDRTIVNKKKNKVFQLKGKLICECCGFDFNLKYGSLGEGFIECHHTKPVSKMEPGEKTSLEDLSLVCSNCHRMIHRQQPWLTIDELKKLFHDINIKIN